VLLGMDAEQVASHTERLAQRVGDDPVALQDKAAAGRGRCQKQRGLQPLNVTLSLKAVRCAHYVTPQGSPM
jgi:hypothetical protein